MEKIHDRVCNSVIQKIDNSFIKNGDTKSILINGKWGSGKTTLLNIIKEKIIQDDKYDVIFINLWNLEMTDSNKNFSLIIELMKHLGQEILNVKVDWKNL